MSLVVIWLAKPFDFDHNNDKLQSLVYHQPYLARHHTGLSKTNLVLLTNEFMFIRIYFLKFWKEISTNDKSCACLIICSDKQIDI